MRFFPTVAWVVALGVFDTSEAASLRCHETELVSDGASKPEVHLKCGEPAFKDSRTEVLFDPVTRRTVYRTIDEWTYNFGSNRFLQTVVFVDGHLTEVRAGDYGR